MRSIVLLAFAALAYGADRFDVASVKPTASIQSGFGKEQIVVQPGSVIMSNIRLRAAIKWAYDLKEYQVSAPAWMGSPGWMGSEIARFEIAAKTAPEASPADLKRMMQALLAERFKLEVHR